MVDLLNDRADAASAGHEAPATLDDLTFRTQLEDFGRRTLTAATLDPANVEALAIATELTRWGWHTGQLPLTSSLLYDIPVLNYYLQTACRHLPSNQLHRRRAVLFHIRAQLPDTGIAPPPPLERPPTTPYTAADVLGIFSWARTQPTPNRRANAHALIALGLGAGLTAHEIITTRVRDIHRSAQGTDITVGPPHTRVVPVLRQLANALPTGRHLNPDTFIFRPQRTAEHANSITNFAQRGPETRLHPLTSRMRATWIVHRLRHPIPIADLAAAAGMRSAGNLLPYARHLTNTQHEALNNARPDMR